MKPKLRNGLLELLSSPSLVLPFFWGLALAVSIIEAYFYPGVFIKHTSISPIYVYISYGIVCFFSALYPNRRKSRYLHFIYRLNIMLVFFFGFLIVFFYLLDLIKYPNFVFSTFHVHTKEIGTSFILCVYLYLISSGKAVGIRVGKPDSSLKARLIIIPLLVWVLLRNLFNLQEMLLPDLSFMIKNPLASYDKKMEEKLGKLFYDYVGFIKENTPENAKILIPPFPAYPWPQTGNGIYMRYFLYPRLLISGGEYESLQNLSNFDYVLIAWGETPTTSESFTHGWPKFDVPSEKIIYFSGEPAKRDSNFYRYYQHKNLESWGLIKVRK